MSNRVQKQQQTQQVVKFDPKQVRTIVVQQLEQTMNAGFAELPKDYKVAAMFAIESLSQLYEIEKVPSTEIAKSLVAMFNDQLDYRKNHVYFFVQNDKNSPTNKSLRYGMQYQGLVHIAKLQAGVTEVIPVLVHEGDTFKTHYQNGVLIIDEHIPTFEGDITGGYCVVEFDNSYRQIRYFTKKELDMRRKRSKDKSQSFWVWEREMYEKTLINGTLKRIIETSSEISMSQDSIYTDEDREFTSGRVVEDAEIIEQGEPTEVAAPMQMEPAPQMQAEPEQFMM